MQYKQENRFSELLLVTAGAAVGGLVARRLAGEHRTTLATITGMVVGGAAAYAIAPRVIEFCKRELRRSGTGLERGRVLRALHE